MTICFISTSAPSPTKAHMINTLRTLRYIPKAELIVPSTRHLSKDPAKHFGEWYRKLRIIKLPAINLVNPKLSKILPLAYKILVLTFSTSCIIYLLIRRPKAIILREQLMIHILSSTKPIHGAKIVYELHDIPNPRTASKSDIIITTSNYQKNLLVKSGINPSKIYVVRNAYEPELLKDLDKINARRKLALPEKTKIAVYTGRLDQWKNIEFLLKAAAHIPECNFILVGQGNVKKLRRLAQRLNIKNVMIVGFHPPSETILYQTAADILIVTAPRFQKRGLASFSPIKLFEYLAVGRPIVAPNLPWIREIVEDGRTALLYNPRDPIDLSEKIKKILYNQNLSERLAKESKNLSRKYTYKERAGRILRAITQGT